MRILVVYYSRTGKNERLAKLLQEKLNCEIERVEEFTRRDGVLGFLKSGMQAVLKRETEIKPVGKDPGDFDVTVIVSPVWAGRIPPPIRTYVHIFRGRFKRLAYASISYSGPGNSSVLRDLESLAQKRADVSMLLREKDLGSQAYFSSVDSFLEKLGQ